MPKITKRVVDALGAADVGRVVRDEELTGFAVRCNADGSKTYLVEYRAGRGRGFPTRRISIGRHGALTPEEARNQAKHILARVAQGADPAAERTARKKDPTVKDILNQALEEHWRPKRKASTAAVFERLINKTLIPEFGSLRLPDLTRAKVRAWHARRGKRPRAANHELAILRKALSLAVADGLITDNPAKGIVLHPETARDRVPTDGELRAIWAAIETAPIREAARLLLKLLALTGCRKGEWLAARWEHVDLEEGTYRLQEADGKAGARDVPLSGPVVALLKSGRTSSPWVISNDLGNGPLTPDNVRSAWDTVLRAAKVSTLR